MFFFLSFLIWFVLIWVFDEIEKRCFFLFRKRWAYGANFSWGFSVSNKKSPFNSDAVCLMKLQSIEAFPSKICMMGRHHREYLEGPFGGGNDEGGGTSGGGVGHTCNNGGANELLGNIYRNDVSSSCGGSSAAADKFARTNLQTFDIFPSLNSTTSYKSPGGMAASVKFPFTFSQWKELERQAMIYKYMMASLPPPRDLLFPISRNFTAAASIPSVCLSGGEIYNMRCSKNGDPEPGRCKRTDGKKWRCSRDVAPQQKYCERHLHKGRSRSRKPVEVKNNGENLKKTRPEQSLLPTLQAHSTASHQFSANEPLLLFNAKNDLSISKPYKEINRDLGLMMEGELIGLREAENHWQHLMKTNMGMAKEVFSIYSSSAPIFHQDYVERQPLNAFSYSNFPAPEIEAPTGFIDAWSIDNYNSNNGSAESCVSPDQGNLSPSSLNLSMTMAAGNVMNEEMNKIQVGSGPKDSDAKWLSPVFWEPFARGGPLAEALQTGSIGVDGSNPASPYDSISTQATTVSSPSGVLHRTLFSHSENSVCNSPTPVAPSSEIAFQWLN